MSILENLEFFFYQNPVFQNKGKFGHILKTFRTLPEINELAVIEVYPRLVQDSHGFHAFMLFENTLLSGKSSIVHLSLGYSEKLWIADIQDFTGDRYSDLYNKMRNLETCVRLRKP